ncbi:MAG: hypothetical protein HRT36_03865 [Alphaproteobacteria bacterium]|nr:hypothetical protein [Alphaproteobacteria bacterium]
MQSIADFWRSREPFARTRMMGGVIGVRHDFSGIRGRDCCYQDLARSLAPNHVERILVTEEFHDGVALHRVTTGFIAQDGRSHWN